jgi:hypothetical protein
MGDRHGLTVVAFAALLAMADATGCKRKESPQPPLPTDSLARGESVEGPDKAYALPLPRLSRVTWRGQNSITVLSNLTHEDLVNFVRARVQNGDVTSGSGATQLRNVVVPSEPKRILTIEIRPAPPMAGGRSQMIVTDTTPLPDDPKLTEEERWKKAGLTPQGKVLDPKQLQ